MRDHEFYAPLYQVLCNTDSALVGVITSRVPRPNNRCRCFTRGRDTFAIVSWPNDRFHWLVLKIRGIIIH